MKQIQKATHKTTETLNITVATDGSGNFENLQKAFDFIMADKSCRFAYINLKKGIYQGQFYFDGYGTRRSGNDIRLYITGQGKKNTIISGNLCASMSFPPDGQNGTQNDAGNKRGTFRSYTAFFRGPEVRLAYLTIENTAGLPPPAGLGIRAEQAVALYAEAAALYCRHVRLLGYQDTLFAAPLPENERIPGGFTGPGAHYPRIPSVQIYDRCSIAGTVDFIFGGAGALFNHCLITVRKQSGLKNCYIAAPSADIQAQTVEETGLPSVSQSGFVFYRCKIKREQSDCPVFLARPWRPFARCVYSKCSFGTVPSPLVWDNWGNKTNEETCFFAEYRNSRRRNSSEKRTFGHKINRTYALSLVRQFKAFFRTLDGLPSTAPVRTLQDFGGKPVPFFDNSKAFAAAKAFFTASGGGTLQLGTGHWHTGPIELCSGLTLELKAGAVLSFIPESDRYRPVKTRWEGVMCWAMHACIFARNAHDIQICGNGVIDGNGENWWKMATRKKTQQGPIDALEMELASLNPDYKLQPGGGGGRNTQFLRPSLVQFFECTRVTVSGVTLQNSPFWTFHPIFCRYLTIAGMSIKNPHTAPNTDGMDIDSCIDVSIRNCNISVGDDGIAIKSGSGKDGLLINRPSRRIFISGCTVEDGHGGIVIGSETAAGIDNVRVENCRFEGTDRGIRIKTRRGRGGDIHHLFFSDLVMIRNLCPLTVNMYYRCGTGEDEKELFSLEPQPTGKDTPNISSIYITRITAEGCRASAGFIAALPEAPLKKLVITDSTFTTDEEDISSPSCSEMYSGIPDVAEKSFRIINAENPEFNRIRINGPEHAFLFH